MPGKRREWIKKITKWLFESPAEKENKNTSHKNDVIPKGTTQLTPKEKLVQEKPEGKPLSPLTKACKIFLDAWEKEGLARNLFVEEDQLEASLKYLDKDFREELIEWLYQICNDPLALQDLATIIRRGRVSNADNIKAIRAFSYVSAFVSPTKTDLKVNSFEEEDKEKTETKKVEGTKILIQSIDENIAKTDESGIPISELNLSVRTFNCLKRNGKNNVMDLAGMQEEDFLYLTNFGINSFNELLERLKDKNIEFPIKYSPSLSNKSEELQKEKITINSHNIPDKLLLPISELNLDIRTYNTLKRNEKNNIIDLACMQEKDLLNLKGFGDNSLYQLKLKLKSIDIDFPIIFSAKDIFSAKKQHKVVKEEKLEPLENYESYWLELKSITEKMNSQSINFNLIFEELINYSRLLGANNKVHMLLNSFNNIIFDIDILISSQSFKEKDQLIENFKYIKPILLKKFFSHKNINEAGLWKNRLSKSLSNQGKSIIIFLLRCSNRTLQSIGDEFSIGRERVRQILSTFEKSIGFKTLDLTKQIEKLREEKDQKINKSAIELWMKEFGRLPIQTDKRFSGEEDEELIKIWDKTIKKTPIERIKTYENFSIDVPKEEFDYHYDLFCSSSEYAGNGYWQIFDHLKEFVLRHAVQLGSPELMPKQTSFPRRIGGIVTRHGGQSKVAKKLGLIYQGQLVSDSGGRRYWTDEKLKELLDDTNRFHKQDNNLMPNYGQVLEFFEAQTEEKYRDKKPNSAIAALTKMGNLHWMEVAQKFHKQFQTGISQKSISVGFIKAFVRDLGDHLGVLSPSELYVLFQAQGISRKEQEKFSRTFDVLIDAVQSGMVDKKDLEDWSNNVDVPSIKNLLDLGGEVKKETSKEEKESLLLERRSKALKDEFRNLESFKLEDVTKDDLPSLDPVKTLRALDKAAGVLENSGTDIDHVEFLKAKATAKLWDACFADEATLINGLRAGQLEEDTYSEEVRSSFLEEFEGARQLQIPSSYKFRDLRGRPRDPKLMQRLVAFRLKRDKRLLNLSGTGTGKTLSAIFSAQVCACKRIFITCPNGVIGSWERTLTSAYPEAVIHIRPDQWQLPELGHGTHVIIVNHERFQDRFAESLLTFCVNYRTDFLVIDEIHQSKRRTRNTSSQRRKLLNEFIRISSNINQDLHVLGLSATPVINNLYEGRSLIELITQRQIDDVTEDVDLNSCMNLYQHFVINGIRMNPGQLPRTDIVLKEVNATKLLPEIIYATRNETFHKVERLLVKPKMEVLGECLERGSKTVIFITLIQSTLKPICEWLQREGYSFSVYTGDEKEATDAGYKDSLEEFIHGTTEVLVASVQCAGTGVDGLQTVCNRAIFFQLPWTSTEFEQTIGRLDRDGTEFDSIKVFLPITNIHLPNGDQWSWCQSKLDRIRSKKDIAKAAVDGEMPDAASMITPQEASKYWLKWLHRLEEKSQENE
tara:strand:- start:274 stop:4611 length:4338 start_codon:yes stop_codon:yes gene_type:complete